MPPATSSSGRAPSRRAAPPRTNRSRGSAPLLAGGDAGARHAAVEIEAVAGGRARSGHHARCAASPGPTSRGGTPRRNGAPGSEMPRSSRLRSLSGSRMRGRNGQPVAAASGRLPGAGSRRSSRHGAASARSAVDPREGRPGPPGRRRQIAMRALVRPSAVIEAWIWRTIWSAWALASASARSTSRATIAAIMSSCSLTYSRGSMSWNDE